MPVVWFCVKQVAYNNQKTKGQIMCLQQSLNFYVILLKITFVYIH